MATFELYRPGGLRNMSKTTTTARIRSDGTVLEVFEEGSERCFTETPLRRMTEAEVNPIPMPVR